MNIRYKEVEINELLYRFLENDISSDDLELLESWFSSEPQAVQYYCEYVKDYAAMKIQVSADIGVDKYQIISSDDLDMEVWHAMAEIEKTAPGIQSEELRAMPEIKYVQKSKVQKTPRKINKFTLYTAIISTAALILMMAYVHTNPRNANPLVGMLTRTVDAHWADAAGTLDEGCDLYAGPMRLVKGIVEIRFDSGAEVIVQAPAEFELESPSQMFLGKGQVVANIEDVTEKRFVVRTPSAVVVDFGTEFGVSVNGGGKTETHVFKGEVELRSGSDPLKFEQSLRLTTGLGGQADQQGQLTHKKVKAYKFVRSDEFATKMRAEEGLSYHRWKAYCYQLQRDPGLVAYYTFEKDRRRPDTLLNQAPVTVNELNGILGAGTFNEPAWVQGRWPQKTALKFERDKDQRIAIPANPALSISGPITIAAWIQFTNEGMGGHLISNRDGYKVNYQLTFNDSQKVSPEHRSRLEFKRYNSTVTGPGFFSPERHLRSGEWYFLAVTHDNQTVRLYINGVLLSSEEYGFYAEPAEAELVIGDVNVLGFERKRFNGIIGEIAIFKRAVNSKEISEMYQAGKP